METQVWSSLPKFDNDEDEDDEEEFLSGNEENFTLPPGKRLAPVGANDEDEMINAKDSDKEYSVASSPGYNSVGGGSSRFWGGSGGGNSEANNGVNKELEEKVKSLERDQEELNTSLMSMTSHFAKVQFRLQQVVGAPAEKKEALLVELQQFAFRGIPDISTPRSPVNDTNSFDYADDTDTRKEKPYDTKSKSILNGVSSSGSSVVPTQPNDEILAFQRKKHTELINQLKGQLEDLECYEYESGEGSVPSSILLERQKVVMEQLKARLNFNMDNIDKLTEEELKAEVDEAVGQLVTPLRMKSHLITQLKTQIEDLEMFIEFLQGEASTLVPVECTGCGTCSKHTSPSKSGGSHKSKRPRSFRKRTKSEQEQIRQQTESILEKAMAVLQLTTLAQFGCGGEQAFYKNSLKNTPKGNHYGDLRAKLEVAVDHILEACSRVECLTDTDCTSRTGSATQESESESQHESVISSSEVSSLVRKELAVAIRDLMHHGLVSGLTGRNVVGSIVPFMGCMSSKNTSSNNVSSKGGGGRSLVHAWDIILKFYSLKLGHEYNAAPARKLSQSFGLDLSGSSSGNKQSLLATIGQIIGSHSPYKRSSDAKFKAFICAGLNKRKLIHWLRLILRNQTILETYYSPWSYVGKTGFDDGFKTLERLNTFVFDLQVDVAIKQFQNMNEAF